MSASAWVSETKARTNSLVVSLFTFQLFLFSFSSFLCFSKLSDWEIKKMNVLPNDRVFLPTFFPLLFSCFDNFIYTRPAPCDCVFAWSRNVFVVQFTSHFYLNLGAVELFFLFKSTSLSYVWLPSLYVDLPAETAHPKICLAKHLFGRCLSTILKICPD